MRTRGNDLYSALYRTGGLSIRSKMIESIVDVNKKRTWIQYACAMFPDAKILSAIGGGALLTTTLDDYLDAIETYSCWNSNALTIDDLNFAKRTPEPLFNWRNYFQMITDLEFGGIPTEGEEMDNGKYEIEY